MSSQRVRGAKFGNAVGGLGGMDDDDLYSGYNEYPTGLTADYLDFDNDGFQTAGKGFGDRRQGMQTGRGKTPGSAMGTRLGTAAGFTRQGTARSGMFTRGGTARPITGIGGEFGGVNRPMTAVRGAGYTASKSQKGFDPNRQGIKSATPSLELKADESPEGKIKQLEERISMLIEESVLASCKMNFKKALDHAKEAQTKERSLLKLREQAGMAESHDWDISFSVLFNLANQYESCEMFTEALSTYQSITKNKFLAHGAKVKINMGNIYLKQNQPTRAIKMYRMAMDQLANNNRDLRLKLMHNMGVVFLRINHPEDAAASFEYIMAEKPTFKTGLHLVVSNYMSGDPERTKRSFRELLEIPLDVDEDEEKYSTLSDDPVSQLLVEVLKNDKLRKLEKEKKTYAERCVLSAARLIAPVIETTFSEGYGWVTESIKSSRHASLAHALEISKALVFLKQRDLTEAVEILKSFEKKETKVATAAATNLSFLFYLQGDLTQAEKYGEAAREADYYNSSAFVNLGNCMAARGEFEKAKQSYQEALSIDSSCVEALYNLGLMSQRSKFYEEALDYFHKIIVLVRNHPHVTYQIGKTHELMGETEVATEWYLKALALSPADSGILKKLAQLYEMDDDRAQAYQYYYDCYKLNPADVAVVEWLSGYLMNDKHVPDRAMIFYDHGRKLQPSDPKWGMAIGACHRKTGNYPQAIEVYQRLNKEFPENVQVLQQLVKLTQDIGSKDFQMYTDELKRVEKAIQAREQSGYSTRLSSGSSNSSARVSARIEPKTRRFPEVADSIDDDISFPSTSTNAAGFSGNKGLLGRQMRPNGLLAKRNEKSAEDKTDIGTPPRRDSQRSGPSKSTRSAMADDDNDDLFANVKLPQDILKF